jgi:CheY-specific phosphatase CheX
MSRMAVSALDAVNLREILITSVYRIFETMLSVKIQILESEDALPPKDRPSIVGCVRFVGRAKGSVYFEVSEESARFVAAAMLHMKRGEVPGVSSINDTVGELSNILGGNIKAQLCDAGLSCSLTIPSITRGNNARISPAGGGRRECCVFAFHQYRGRAEVVVRIDS